MNANMTGINISGKKFPSSLVNQTPVFDGRRKHNKPVKKHRGNIRREPNWMK